MNTASVLEEFSLPDFVSSQELQKGRANSLKTPIPRLNEFLWPMHWQGRLTEWGVPAGSIARLIPAIVAKAFQQECLWICDSPEAQIYPNSWTGLGFNLNNLLFLQESEPLLSLRTVIHEKAFPFLIIDCRQRLNQADLHFLAQTCQQQSTSIFLFRPFYLSHRNGNPFSQQRINSSYSIHKKSFQLSLIKGRGSRRHLQLPFHEVLCG